MMNLAVHQVIFERSELKFLPPISAFRETLLQYRQNFQGFVNSVTYLYVEVKSVYDHYPDFYSMNRLGVFRPTP